jgi:hypothetical protein
VWGDMSDVKLNGRTWVINWYYCMTPFVYEISYNSLSSNL